MVPSAVVVLEALPVTANGKLDRRALPEPDHARPDLVASYTPPTTEVERTVAAVWREVLELNDVGVEDNFFDLGGHSLLLVRARSRLEQTLGTKIQVVELFKYPTIATLARHLAHASEPEPALTEVDERARRQRDANVRRARAARERTDR
jgi:acyl carrier protein